MSDSDTFRIQFLGAAGQVTGSRTYVQAGGLHLLVDAGLFQERAYQGRNWDPFLVPPERIDQVLLTHAHLDHAGLLPKLVREGFRGPILATPATRELAKIILEDAAEIQEEDAAFKKARHEREGRKGRYPEKPLYTRRDAADTLSLFRTVKYGAPMDLNKRVKVTFHDAGHILGSAMIEIEVDTGGQKRTLWFSGDIGPQGKSMLRDPQRIEKADYVVMESTYGDRDHEDAGAVDDQLCKIIHETVEEGGNLLIPTFAVDRAQELMFHLGRLVHERRIPPLMVFLDSPMAVDVTEVFRAHRECLNEASRRHVEAGEPLFAFKGMHFVQSTEESRAINRIRGTCVILAGSGMCTAGRIKHHLIRNISRPESTVLFVGYQAAETLGRQILDGAQVVRIQNKRFEVRAKVRRLFGLSAHADRSGLLDWLGGLKSAPRKVFLNHGEAGGSDALAKAIRERWSWPVEVPAYESAYDLT